MAALLSPMGSVLAGIDEAYIKPADKKTWGQLLADFVGYRGFGKSYALVVGISDFDHLSSLPTTNDPVRMRDFLIHEAGFDYVHVLTDEKATKSRIEELMVDDLPGMIHKNDQFLFYWSGHGTQRPNDLGGQVGYLPLASSPKNRYSTMISMVDIRRWDEVLRAKHALFLLDACFSGLAGSAVKSDPRQLQIDQLDKPAHHLVSAGTDKEETIAGDRWGGSLFTDAVLRAVRGEADAQTAYPRDGVVSLSELIGYVKTRVAIEAPAAGWTKPITPQPYALRHSAGEFFFLTNERKVAMVEGTGTQHQGHFEHGMPVVDKGDAQSVRPIAALPSITEAATQPPSITARVDPATLEAGLNLRPEDRLVVQEALTALGFDTRGADGVFGANTRRAIAGWQRERREDPTGYLTPPQYGKLLAEAEAHHPTVRDDPGEPITASSELLEERRQQLVALPSQRESGKPTDIAPAAGVAPVAKLPSLDLGRFHALVIGNNAYTGLPKLDTAVADAEAVGRVLGEKYGFEVTLLRNANRYQILSALNQYRANLTENDNFLIYYAGHGELDEANQRGHWLPVDAEPDSPANWISNVQITDILNAMSAKRVLVVADSCYSGVLTQASLAQLDSGMAEEARLSWLRALAKNRSRTALTSGGLQPTLDSGGGGHSVFARALLEVLERNNDLIEGQRLHREVSARVTYPAELVRFKQVPQYGPIKYTGHEAGEFFLVPHSG